MKKTELAWVIIYSIIVVILVNLAIASAEDINYKEKIIYHIIYSIWSFGIVPSYRYFYLYIKSKSFIEGAILGGILKIFGFIFLPILLAPYFMVKYYIDFSNNAQHK